MNKSKGIFDKYLVINGFKRLEKRKFKKFYVVIEIAKGMSKQMKW